MTKTFITQLHRQRS